jgi:alpha,alpha-trehalase
VVSQGARRDKWLRAAGSQYRTDETDDGMSGKEGTFLIC